MGKEEEQKRIVRWEEENRTEDRWEGKKRSVRGGRREEYRKGGISIQQ